jgi:hypothetical protein
VPCDFEVPAEDVPADVFKTLVKRRSVQLNRVMEEMGAGAFHMSLVLLDCCRNWPFKEGKRGLGGKHGLASADATKLRHDKSIGSKARRRTAKALPLLYCASSIYSLQCEILRMPARNQTFPSGPAAAASTTQVVYAAAAGCTANDASSRSPGHSPFTAALLKHFTEPVRPPPHSATSSSDTAAPHALACDGGAAAAFSALFTLLW